MTNLEKLKLFLIAVERGVPNKTTICATLQGGPNVFWIPEHGGEPSVRCVTRVAALQNMRIVLFDAWSLAEVQAVAKQLDTKREIVCLRLSK